MADTHKYVLDKDNTEYSGLDLKSDPSYSEILKGSLRRNVVVKDSFIGGGSEDCVDMVRGENLEFRNLDVETHEKTRTFFTLKGGIKGIKLKDIRFSGKSNFCWDISLGDFTIYDIIRKRPRVRDIILENVRRVDNPDKPVVVLVLHSEEPKVIGGNVKIKRVPKFLVDALFTIKRKTTKKPDNMDENLYDWEKKPEYPKATHPWRPHERGENTEPQPEKPSKDSGGRWIRGRRRD